jgi:hypothetical protein
VILFGDMDVFLALTNFRLAVSAIYKFNNIDDRELARPLQTSSLDFNEKTGNYINMF